MLHKSTGFAIASSILIVYRLYLIFESSSYSLTMCKKSHSSVFSESDGVPNTYGPCKNGIRIFFGGDGKATKTQMPCSMFDTDVLDMTSCVADKLTSSSPSVTTHIMILVLQVLFLLSAALPFAATYTCFNAIFKIAGGFLNPYFIMVPALIFLVIGEVSDQLGLGKIGGKLRGANGRFLKE